MRRSPTAPAHILTLCCAILLGGFTPATAQLAAGQDKFFGSIIEGRPGKEKDVPESLHRLFNKITPENSAKWGDVELRDYFAFRQNPLDADPASALDQAAFSRELTVFPNPANDALNVAWPGGAATVRLLDGLGREVRSVRAAGEGLAERLPVAGLTPGRYVLQVVSVRGAGSRVVVVR